MKTRYTSLKVSQILLLCISSLLLFSCGTYQSVANDDGIYDDERPVKEERKVIIANQKEYKQYNDNYFTKELERLESLDTNDVFTDVDAYRSDSLDIDDERFDDRINNEPWGYNDNNDVVVNINLNTSPYWNDFGYWGWGFNNWNVWGDPFWGNRWRNRFWGFNNWHPYHNLAWGWGNGFYNPWSPWNYGYNRPYYRGYRYGHFNNRNYRYGRRTAYNNTFRRNNATTRRAVTSRRNASTRRSANTTRRNTRATTSDTRVRRNTRTAPTRRNTRVRGTNSTPRRSTRTRSTAPTRRSSSNVRRSTNTRTNRATTPSRRSTRSTRSSSSNVRRNTSTRSNRSSTPRTRSTPRSTRSYTPNRSFSSGSSRASSSRSSGSRSSSSRGSSRRR